MFLCLVFSGKVTFSSASSLVPDFLSRLRSPNFRWPYIYECVWMDALFDNDDGCMLLLTMMK